jgi:uncharacterized protein
MTAQTSHPSHFNWDKLGDLAEGRPNLGPDVAVSVYRLMQYTLRDILESRLGSASAREIFVDAGRLAGSEFCKNVLDTKLGFNEFIADLQAKLKSMNIGVLRVEKADLSKMEFVVTVSEDLDCSGLPLSGETVCDYDEGFIAGILDVYTSRPFTAKEIDCWATGDRTCRFVVKPKE